MVFGWGKKKPKKQEPEIAPQKKQILLSDVPNVVDEIRSIRTKTIIAETKTFKNKIKSSCETILHIAIDLERDTLNVDDIDIHLKRLVERGKKEVISIIKRESIIQLPEINSYDDVKNFNTIAGRMISFTTCHQRAPRFRATLTQERSSLASPAAVAKATGQTAAIEIKKIIA